jgi:hypothetical protein
VWSDNNVGLHEDITFMTPQEAAKLVDWPNPNRHKEIHDFVLSASARDIQLFVHNIQTNTTDVRDWRECARIALDIRLAEDAERTAQKLVSGTDKLVQHSAKLTERTDRLIQETLKLTGLTRSLNRLTFILGVLAVLQVFIMFYEYFSKSY